MDYLEVLADLATIATAGIAAAASARYLCTRHSQMRKLEALLATKTQPSDDSLTTKQLAIALIMTEPQVIEAASRSKKIEPWAGQSGNESRFRIKRRGSLVK